MELLELSLPYLCIFLYVKYLGLGAQKMLVIIIISLLFMINMFNWYENTHVFNGDSTVFCMTFAPPPMLANTHL